MNTAPTTFPPAAPGGIPELLAPAGDWDALRAAVTNGADGVYFGLNNFNARHRATNFTLQELPEVMTFLHGRNVKGYVTFNTLIFSDELTVAQEHLQAIARAGVDAVLVQDLGVAALLHRLAPTLAIHGSTQLTLTEARGIEFVRALGVSRVVLARELSLAEIKRITASTTLPVEVFVHGALCVAYSGQCLTSESIGGRSANRGQCAQACRLPYELVVDGQPRDLGDKAYLLSPSDLAAYDLIGELTAAGVASFKIEGRLKSAHYVAATCQTYRAALDAAAHHQPFAIAPQQKMDLEQSFSRGFTQGFLGGANHQELVAGRFSKSRGLRVGTVVRVTPTKVVVHLDGPRDTLKAGDGVVFDEGHPEQWEQGGRIYHVDPVAGDPQALDLTFGAGAVNFSAVAIGALVWKTDDPATRRRLEQSFARDIRPRRQALHVSVFAHVGAPLRVVLTDNRHAATATWDQPLEKATRHPLSIATLREQFGRLGDTPFELGALTLDAADGPMVPKSVLNDLRRQAVQSLLAQREAVDQHAIAEADVLEHMRAELRSAAPPAASPVPAGAALYVLTRTHEQLAAVLAWSAQHPAEKPAMVYCDFEDVRRYPEAVEACRAAGMPIGLATLRIVKPTEEGMLRQIGACGPDAVLVRNLAAVSFYRQEMPQLPLLGDYALNVANELTAGILTGAGLQRLVPSHDLNWSQLQALLGRCTPGLLEIVIHQHMPMFHMEHCVFAHTLSSGKDYHDCGRPCDHHQIDLRDRMGAAHPLIPDAGCRNTLFNALAQTALEFLPQMTALGLRHFRVELLRQNTAEVATLLTHYAAVLAGRQAAPAAIHALKVLNGLGVTRGTLQRS